ncbi:diguanylate cyclase [Paenibacillus sp. TRM 82003]|nr:diguanylate cyclase [Paenibacillus sp. TRM 82003]
MASELLPYVTTLVFGGALSVWLCVYAWFKLRHAPGGKYYILAAGLAAMFNFAYLFELTSDTLEEIAFWLRVEYIPLPFLPAFTLLMCSEYVGLRWRRRYFWLLMTMPLLTVFLQWTNELHHLHYTYMRLREDVPFPIVELGRGPYFTVYSIFVYGCLAASVGILLSRLTKVKHRFRLQILAMIAGLLTPVVASVFYVSGRSPYGIDLGPVFLSVSYVFHAIALVRFRMFDVAPIAKEAVFESMGEGVIVWNAKDVVVDYNAAMRQAIPSLVPSAIGRPIAEVLQGNEALADLLRTSLESDYTLYVDGEEVHYHVRFAPVRNRRGVPIGMIATFANITERVRMEETLKRLASTDSLTKLLNKAAFLERSEQGVAEMSATTEGGASMLMFDIDEFKRVNDTFGHGAGDIALSLAAAATQDVLGERPIAGRYGGDEFVVCLPGTSLEEARDVAERIRLKIEGNKLVLSGELISITSSFGVSHLQAASGDPAATVQRLIDEADQALYEAKRRGRNRVETYETSRDISREGAGRDEA